MYYTCLRLSAFLLLFLNSWFFSELDINECASTPCENGGTCVDKVNGFSCKCVAGFTGANCETGRKQWNHVSLARTMMCAFSIVNSITQQVSLVTFCSYFAPFTFSDINECSSSPCLNGGTCTDGINSFSCECYPGYTGKNCETGKHSCCIISTKIQA